MKNWLFLGLVTVLLLSILGVSGCGSSTADNPFLEMLKLIPDTPGTQQQVYISDHARIREIYNIPLPSSDTDEGAIEGYLMTLAGGITIPQRLAEVSFISGMGPLPCALNSPIRRQSIGFGPLDVDVDISAGVPPQVFEAIKGNFDLSVIEDALSQYDESVMPEIGSYQDVVVYDWGPDIHLDTRLIPPAFDHLGRGETIAVQRDYIFRAYTIDCMEAMIDVSQGREWFLGLSNLADIPDYNLMATVLSEMGAYSCFLSSQVMYIGNNYLLELLAEQIGWTSDMSTEEAIQMLKTGIIAAAGGELLSLYRTYATGIGEDDEGPFMTLVFIYDSPEAASSNVDIFKRQIESGVSLWTSRPWQTMVDGSEVWAEDCSLRVKLRGAIVGAWLDIVHQRDTIMWCES